MRKQDKFIIDGQTLKAAREAKGLSLKEMAALVTLSRAQLLQIEQGGEQAFYNIRHKILATRKYARALTVAVEEVIITDHDIPNAEPQKEIQEASAAPVHTIQSTAALSLPLTGLRYHQALPIRVLAVIGLLSAIISLYAIGHDDKGSGFGKIPLNEDRVKKLSPLPSSDHASLRAAPVNPAIGSTGKNITQTSAESAGIGDTKAESVLAAQEHCQPEPPGSQIKTWSPDYERKAGTRLYIQSSHSGMVCITDASGKSQLLSLKPMMGQAFTGKPPYVVRSSRLAGLDIYLQGMRVKIPNEIKAIKLIPAQSGLPASPQTIDSQANDSNS